MQTEAVVVIPIIVGLYLTYEYLYGTETLPQQAGPAGLVTRFRRFVRGLVGLGR